MRGGIGGVVMLANWEKHFIRVCENLSLCPRILYPLVYHRKDLIALSVAKILLRFRSPAGTKSYCVDCFKEGFICSFINTKQNLCYFIFVSF